MHTNLDYLSICIFKTNISTSKKKLIMKMAQHVQYLSSVEKFIIRRKYNDFTIIF